MSTASMQRPLEKTGSVPWSSVFPNEQVTSQQSALFVKKLLAVAVSNITYLRAIFPESAFGDRCLEDLNLKVLRDDSTCPGACQVIRWIKGCFDALDKKYLKTIIVGIYLDSENPETVIESYTFKFSYAGKGGVDVYRNNQHISGAHSAAETKKATMRLLRTIVVLTQSLHSLPDDVMMTMKLLYYDDVTPTDYEPPGFTSSDCDNFSFEDEPMNIKVGDVTTPFHTVKMRIKTDAKQFEMVDEDEPVGTTAGTDQGEEPQAPSTQTREESVAMKDESTMLNEVPQPLEADDVPNITPQKPVAQDPSDSESVTVVTKADQGVRCPCDCNEDDGLMILCAECNYWQHAVCFAVLKEERAPQRHICNLCADHQKADMGPTDPSLQGLSEVAIQAQCLWRRALLCCLEAPRMLQTTLSRRLGVEMTVASGLVNRLEREGYLKSATKGKRLGKLVVKEKIMNEAFPKYLEPANDQQPSQDSQNTDNNPAENRIIDNEMDKLTSRTEDIKLSMPQGKRSHNNKQIPPTLQSEKEDKPEKTRKGRKRAKSVCDDSQYELSNSQELSQQDVGSLRAVKRKKASIAAKAIMV